MPDIATITKANNNRLMSDTGRDRGNEPQKPCNCRRKDQCPMSGKWKVKSIVYKARLSSENNEKEYIGLTENTFKQRSSNHPQSIRHDKYEYSTELSKYVWGLKNYGENHDISWSVHKQAPTYPKVQEVPTLCCGKTGDNYSRQKHNFERLIRNCVNAAMKINSTSQTLYLTHWTC